MPNPQCLENIKNQPPPYNIPCSAEYCAVTASARNELCFQNGFPPNTPVLNWDNSIESSCYCCCGGTYLQTPVQVTQDEFAFVENLQPGDTLMIADQKLNWQTGKVAVRSEAAAVHTDHYLVSFRLKGSGDPRTLLVGADHRFLLADGGGLKKVQHLIPGDQLQAADESAARVDFVAAGEFTGRLQSLELEGDFDGTDPSGHLYNANGVVCADFVVQAHLEAQAPSGSLAWEVRFDEPERIVGVDSPSYLERFNSQALGAFVVDRERWPEGFTPVIKDFVPIPADAIRFLRKSQAVEMRKSAKFRPESAVKVAIEKLLNIYRASYPEIAFGVDWLRMIPNAFAWPGEEENVVLLSGGLVRLKGISDNGLSLILADMITRIEDNLCVAEADYFALNTMRVVWPNSILGTMAPEGIKQVESAMFDPIKRHRHGDKRRLCEKPSLDCRAESFWAGLSFLPQPECGIPGVD